MSDANRGTCEWCGGSIEFEDAFIQAMSTAVWHWNCAADLYEALGAALHENTEQARRV